MDCAIHASSLQHGGTSYHDAHCPLWQIARTTGRGYTFGTGALPCTRGQASHFDAGQPGVWPPALLRTALEPEPYCAFRILVRPAELYGIMAVAWFESTLSTLLESTEVTT